MNKRFQKIHIEISNICNLQCSFCPPVERKSQLMSVDLFAQILEQVAPLTERVCFHLMGEPLVHPDFDKMVDICDQHQVGIFLVSNGILLKPERFDSLLHRRFDQINFSLHSFFDNYPDRDPTRYLERIFSFTERAMRERPELYLNYRLWNLNDPLGSQTPNTTMLKRICDRFDVTVPTEINIRKRKSVKLLNRLYLHFDTQFTWPALNLPILGKQGTCYGLSSHFGILVDGTVVPCCLDKEACIELGNVQQASVETILDSAQAQAMIHGFKQRRLVESLCQRCQYIERFQPHKIEVITV